MEAKRVLFEKDLPTEFRPLIDSNRPIPSDVQFFEGPPATKKGALNWLILGVVSAVLAVVLFIGSAKTRAPVYESGANVVSKALFSGSVICAIAMLGWIWKAWADYKRAKATDQGTADRQGLFLTPNAIFIWSDVNRLFPREKVISFTSDPITKDGVVFLNSILTFKNATDQPEEIPHIEDCLDDNLRATAVTAMVAWAATT